MSIALRKQKILAAVIENYIATGEPVGSKLLQNGDGFNVSSATIRNELADLTASGYLRQPHTSAGRVPTELGYRYYVDNLMTPKPLDEKLRAYVTGRLDRSADAPEHVLSTAVEVLSELCDTAALATTPTGEQARVYKIKFVPTGRSTSMLVLITSQGMVKSRLFRCDFDITPAMLNVFDRALNEKAAGLPLSGVNRAFAQTFAAGFGELGLLMPDMLMALMDACSEAAGVDVYVKGATKLLSQRDYSLASARAVLELLDDNSERGKLLKGIPDDTTIYIGRENLSPALRLSSLVSTGYMITGRPAGLLAVIGSVRTDYASTVSAVEFTAGYVSELIDEIVSGQK